MTTRSHSFRVCLLGALFSAGCGSATVQTPAPVAPPAPEPQKSAWPEPKAPESSGETVVQTQFETSAQAVEPGSKFLLAIRFQIPAENLTTQGYGEQYLKVNSQSPERQNRRVAMRRITPLLQGQNQQ